jgi:hypothetical protein
MRAIRCGLSQKMKIERMSTCHHKEPVNHSTRVAAKTASVHVQLVRESLVEILHASRISRAYDCGFDLIIISECETMTTDVWSSSRLMGGLSIPPSAVLLDGRFM